MYICIHIYIYTIIKVQNIGWIYMLELKGRKNYF